MAGVYSVSEITCRIHEVPETLCLQVSFDGKPILTNWTGRWLADDNGYNWGRRKNMLTLPFCEIRSFFFRNIRAGRWFDFAKIDELLNYFAIHIV